MLIYWRVNSAFYSGHPALRPAGRLKLFKIVPDDFVANFALSRLRSQNFEKGSRIFNQSTESDAPGHVQPIFRRLRQHGPGLVLSGYTLLT
ncbi:MAG: hypothetical protein ACRESK_03850, partial [Gammaproteobacteria bacterium]